MIIHLEQLCSERTQLLIFHSLHLSFCAELCLQMAMQGMSTVSREDEVDVCLVHATFSLISETSGRFWDQGCAGATNETWT